MPSANLVFYFQDDVSVVNHWLVNGMHYSRTRELQLSNLEIIVADISKFDMEALYDRILSIEMFK